MTADRGGSDRNGEDSRPGAPDRVGNVLERLLQKLGIDEAVAGQDAVGRWEGVVGERIARVTRARGVASGVLYVDVSSSGWLTELNLMRHDILARLNAGRTRGRIERIVFRLAEE